MTRKRAQAIIIRNNEVLFGYGKIGTRFGHFFIGGGIERGETPNEAVLREIREETNTHGKIIFQFSKEIKNNEYTFLVDIGEQSCELGYDPEDESFPEEKNLQSLIWIPLNKKAKFTSIDIEYFRVIVNECKERGYKPSWIGLIEELVTD